MKSDSTKLSTGLRRMPAMPRRNGSSSSSMTMSPESSASKTASVASCPSALLTAATSDDPYGRKSGYKIPAALFSMRSTRSHSGVMTGTPITLDTAPRAQN